MPEEEVTTIWKEEGLEELMISARDALAILKVFPNVAQDISREMKRGTRTVFAQRRALIAIRTEWRTQHALLIEVSRAMGAVGMIGKNIVSMWQAYTMAQMRVADASRDLRTATMDVALIQAELNRMQERGITTGEDYLNVQLKLNQAKSQAAARSSELARAQQENIMGYVGLGLQSIGLIANLVDLAYHMSIIRTLHYAVGGAAGAEAVAKTGLIGVLWAEVKARIAALSLGGPWGWALLAGAAVAGAAALAFWLSKRTMHTGGIVPETGWWYMKKGETVIPEGRAGIVVYFSPVIYGERPTREEAYDEFIDKLRRRGLI